MNKLEPTFVTYRLATGTQLQHMTACVVCKGQHVMVELDGPEGEVQYAALSEIKHTGRVFRGGEVAEHVYVATAVGPYTDRIAEVENAQS